MTEIERLEYFYDLSDRAASDWRSSPVVARIVRWLSPGLGNALDRMVLGAPESRSWHRRAVCPPERLDTVHDHEGTVWRRQRDGRWIADVQGATPGNWEALVRVFGPITEGLPPAPGSAS